MHRRSRSRCIETPAASRARHARARDAGPLPGGLDTQPRRSFVARGRYSTSGECCWSSSRRRDGGAGGDVSRPLHSVAGGWAALGRCRVVCDTQRRRSFVARGRYSTSGECCWSSSRRRDGGAGGDVSRPLQEVAGGWFALSCCRVVSIRSHGAPSSRVATTRPAVSAAGPVARSREGGACSGCIETTPSVRWGLVRAGLLPGGLDTRRRARWRSPSPLFDQRKVSLVE